MFLEGENGCQHGTQEYGRKGGGGGVCVCMCVFGGVNNSSFLHNHEGFSVVCL